MIGTRPPARPGHELSANHRVVTPDYFATLNIPVRRGRTFTAQDSATSPMVALVDDAFVRRYFEGQNPIGQRIDIGNGTDGSYEIVGVVGGGMTLALIGVVVGTLGAIAAR